MLALTQRHIQTSHPFSKWDKVQVVHLFNRNYDEGVGPKVCLSRTLFNNLSTHSQICPVSPLDFPPLLQI